VPGADAASVVIGPPAEPELVASSSPRAQTADGAQLNAGSGPTFDAFATGRPVHSADAQADPRWPRLRRPGGGAAGPPMRCCLAVPLRGRSSGTPRPRPIGVLTFYGDDAAALGAAALGTAEQFAARAEGLAADGDRIAELERTAEQLTEALRSRAVIDQAKGVIMHARSCGADEAFHLLTRASNSSGRKVRDLAQEIVAGATFDAPPVPRRRPRRRRGGPDR
jgi:hypothetical protein